MEGYGIFFFIVFTVVLIVIVSASLLKSILPDDKSVKVLSVVFTGLLLVNIAIFGFSFYIGGWSGLGIGVIAIIIFIGMVIGGFLFVVIHYFLGRRKKSD